MKSAAKTVAQYLKTFDGETKETLTTIRNMVSKVIPDFEETMKYGMPTYNKGENVFAFAKQKHHISIYIDEATTIKKYQNKIGKHSLGKNCIRYSKPKHIDFAGLRKLLEEAYSD